MPPSPLVLVGVLATSAGILGALLWPTIQRRLRLTSRCVLIISASIIPLYGVIGLFAPRGARCPSPSRDVRARSISQRAIWCVPKSCARALYAEVVPPGEEARWYGCS
ncbi:hypothetical protein F5148DRAFT_194883 [Russula earlei]|uniref:Uncharacterized protein n=1 Tax=Russula earlei TaxID=71964 RepID=A0ACC0U527_9AGAM|nr:hypothetical protein F5148DRAFT_194883 [Russula earlei]